MLLTYTTVPYSYPGAVREGEGSSQRAKQVKENRERLTSIIKTNTLWTTKHRDLETLLNKETESPVNERHFRALLKFRIDAGDKNIRSPFEK